MTDSLEKFWPVFVLFGTAFNGAFMAGTADIVFTGGETYRAVWATSHEAFQVAVVTAFLWGLLFYYGGRLLFRDSDEQPQPSHL